MLYIVLTNNQKLTKNFKMIFFVVFTILSSAIGQNEETLETLKRKAAKEGARIWKDNDDGMEGNFAHQASVLVKSYDAYHDLCKLRKDYLKIAEELSLTNSNLNDEIEVQMQKTLGNIKFHKMNGDLAGEVFGNKGEEIFYKIKQNPRDIPSKKQLNILRDGLKIYTKYQKKEYLLKKPENSFISDVKLLLESFKVSKLLLATNDPTLTSERAETITTWFKKMNSLNWIIYTTLSGHEVRHWNKLKAGKLKEKKFEELFVEIVDQWKRCL